MTIPAVWLPVIPALLFFVFACGRWYESHLWAKMCDERDERLNRNKH